MGFNYSKLRGRIVEKFGTNELFAKKLGITPTSVGRKLAGTNGWKQEEISLACELLGIQHQEIPEYFFTEKV